MQQPNAFIKIATLFSSLLLVGGCVSYRAGAFNGLFGTSAQPVEAARDRLLDQSTAGAANATVVPAGLPTPAATPSDFAVFSGTKAPLRASVFDVSVPPFGGHPGTPGAQP